MIALAGISHKTAPLEIREAFALADEELANLLPSLSSSFGPAIVLSTCNRTEIYVSEAENELDVQELARTLSRQRGPEMAAADGHFYSLVGRDAVRHLFRVAAGLESMVLGESQILGQVRDALHLAQRVEASDASLVRLFQSAVGAGRRLRSGAGVTGSAASVSAAAIELARRQLGDLSSCSVLVVSAGEAAKLAAWSLSRSGAGKIVIAGRTLSRATRLAEDLGATAVSMHNLTDAIADADIVVSSTGARDFCLANSAVARAMSRRPDRPLLLIDLAVPRDIDPAAAGLPGVTLFDIDALQPLMAGASCGSSDSPDRLEAAIDDEVERYMSWLQLRGVVPTIAALRSRAEGIRRAELDKTLGRLPNLSDDERDRIEALTAAIVKKLLHQPIMCLRESDRQPAHLDAVRELFALQPGGD